MKYKLLVLDVDGTLLNNAREISNRTLAALLKVQQMGVRIVLASGRPTYGLMPLAKTLELGNYGGFILSYNGCQIIKAQNGEILFERRINPEMLPYLEKKARKNNFAIFTYHDDIIITDTPENEYIISEAVLNNQKIIKEDEFSTAVDFPPCKCMLVSNDEEALIVLEDHWRRQLNGTLDVFRSEPYFLEVVPCGIDKANTLGALMEKLNIKREEVIAIGDGVCDVTMLQLAGMGIAMGHSQDSVKVCADYVTASNEEDGVAQAVEKMILAEVHAAEIPLDVLNARARHALMGNLGIQYTYASEDRIEATMPVDQRTRQPFGILHGGATLALAETVAGLGSMIICQPDEIVVGMQVSGNHISSAHEGDTVRAIGTIVHKGRSSHVWNVDVFTSTNKLVSSIRVVNSVLKKG
ncbi:Cof-type HAD-IIB family hydrolase [Bacteroides cutis]|jgi:Cof subfamily protein (haloacid dehalogenase superfamily)|uniref:Cof-type HAD-IIB family hydrolase n=1 Tax=Bacteroides cutis TaxID=2024197 RepID=UPI000C78A580|nr:Cof-type HAD-IIB family hydrolase [Bacteroides cutis]